MLNLEFFSNHAGLSLLFLAAHKYILLNNDINRIYQMLFSVKVTQLNYQIMDKVFAFLAIWEVQCGCTIRTLI